jgi:hypothetical protein
MAEQDLLTRVQQQLDARLQELRAVVAETEALTEALRVLDELGVETSADASASADAPAQTPARRPRRPRRKPPTGLFDSGDESRTDDAPADESAPEPEMPVGSQTTAEPAAQPDDESEPRAEGAAPADTRGDGNQLIAEDDSEPVTEVEVPAEQAAVEQPAAEAEVPAMQHAAAEPDAEDALPEQPELIEGETAGAAASDTEAESELPGAAGDELDEAVDVPAPEDIVDPDYEIEQWSDDPGDTDDAETTASATEPPDEERAKIIEAVAERPGVSLAQLAGVVSMQEDPLTAILDSLVEEGWITRDEHSWGMTGYSVPREKRPNASSW